SYLIFSLTGWCRQIQTGFLRSRLTQEIPPQDFSYVYRPVTFCGAAFQSASSFLFLIMWVLQPLSAVADRFGLFPVRSPLLGKSLNCFLFLKVLRCFSSPRLLSDKRQNIPAMPGMGFPIRIPADLCYCAAPRSFSQLYTSFIAQVCQGIHHTPSVV